MALAQPGLASYQPCLRGSLKKWLAPADRLLCRQQLWNPHSTFDIVHRVATCGAVQVGATQVGDIQSPRQSIIRRLIAKALGLFLFLKERIQYTNDFIARYSVGPPPKTRF